MIHLMIYRGMDGIVANIRTAAQDPPGISQVLGGGTRQEGRSEVRVGVGGIVSYPAVNYSAKSVQ
jgi:hypothetical protein